MFKRNRQRDILMMMMMIIMMMAANYHQEDLKCELNIGQKSERVGK